MATGTKLRGRDHESRIGETDAVLEGERGPVGLTLSTEQVWKAIAKTSFASSAISPRRGSPDPAASSTRPSAGGCIVAVAPDSWKARHIAASGRVAVTVPVRRGGLLSLVAPIPPATDQLPRDGERAPGRLAAGSPLLKELGSLSRPSGGPPASIIEILPEGAFVTYGLGVSLSKHARPGGRSSARSGDERRST